MCPEGGVCADEESPMRMGAPPSQSQGRPQAARAGKGGSWSRYHGFSLSLQRCEAVPVGCSKLPVAAQTNQYSLWRASNCKGDSERGRMPTGSRFSLPNSIPQCMAIWSPSQLSNTPSAPEGRTGGLSCYSPRSRHQRVPSTGVQSLSVQPQARQVPTGQRAKGELRATAASACSLW